MQMFAEPIARSSFAWSLPQTNDFRFVWLDERSLLVSWLSPRMTASGQLTQKK
jgi:hypothetical protein